MIKKWISDIEYYFFVRRKIKYSYRVDFNSKIDSMISRIIEESFKIKVGTYGIYGTLLNGEEFYLWNGNHWYGWCSEGYVSNEGWNDGSKYSLLGIYHPNINPIHGNPSERMKNKLRSYFLSIDKNFFRENKEYDLTPIIRDRKIKSIINE
jgi:hypothetical protein